MAAARTSLRALAGACTLLALTACTTPEPAPPSATTPAKVAGQASAAPVSPITGGPLVASDLPGWKSSSQTKSGDWVSACDKSSGLAAKQRKVQASALTAPGGIPVAVRVAHYDKGAATKPIQATADLGGECPLVEVGAGQRSTALLESPVGDRSVGTLVTDIDADGASTGTQGYWVTQVGDATVEVWSSGLFAGDSTDDAMVDFVTALRDAALAKATGQRIGSVPVPQQVAPGAGSDAEGVSGVTGTDSGITSQGLGDDPQVEIEGPGLETGPGEILGTETPGEAEMPDHKPKS